MARKKKARYAYRSKFEERLGRSLDDQGVKFGYESETFKITVGVAGSHCKQCGGTHIARHTKFTPDFFLPGFIVEAKGRFTANDRKRILALRWDRECDLRERRQVVMLFMRDNTLSKTSKTRYSDWCKANGIPYAIGNFPKEWLK